MLHEIICNNCGEIFLSVNPYRQQCSKCTLEINRKKEKYKEHATKSINKILEETKEADKLGLSYGQYKGKGGAV